MSLIRGRWFGRRMLRAGYRPTGDGVVPFTTGLVDDLVAAGDPVPQQILFSHRVYSNYTGAIMRVRRASDNVEADINATTAGLLDTAAIVAHCGASDGFVVTWYDQSGNARHYTQATASEQPRIYNGTTGLVLVDGVAQNPAPTFARASTQSLNRAGWLNTASAYTRAYIGRGTTTGTQSWTTHDPLRYGSAAANAIHFNTGGGTNRQFTPVVAITTLAGYRSGFAGGTQIGSIPLLQNGVSLSQASVANGTNTVTFTTGFAGVGNMGDANANGQDGPLIFDASWAADLSAGGKVILDDFMADNI